MINYKCHIDKSHGLYPTAAISEQVVCLCTTAVTQSSNTNVFSKCSSVRCIQPQFVLSAAQPAGCAFYFPGVFRNFKQSIIFFRFGAKTLPTVEFTAWTLVLISWLSWASSELLILLPPYHLLSRFSLEYLKCFPRMLKCSPLQKIHQGRAERNVQTGHEYAPAGKHRLYFIMAPTEVMWSKKIFVQVCDWINKLRPKSSVA